MVKVIKSLFGWFDNVTNKPTYDPGLLINCMVCEEPLDYPARKIRTISFLTKARSYFYRIHEDCNTDENQKKIEGLILDKLTGE